LSRKPVTTLPAAPGELAAADLAPTLPTDIPLQIIRSWSVENGKLVLRYVLKNKTNQPVEIGALGIPMIFNNVMNHRSLDQAHAICSFYDPYIGEDAGYLQVTRLNGHGPALLVVPDGKTPFEAYKPILNRRGSDGKPEIFNDPTPRGMTFEGFYDWMVHSAAYQENEWSKVQPWNPPTALTLAPGESKTYGLKFIVSDSIRDIEKTLARNRRPVAVGIPGYVLPMDIQGTLFLKYPEAVHSIEVQPSHAIEIQQGPTTNHGWRPYTLRGMLWGQARVTVTYSDGLRQTISYRVIKPEAQVIADLGHFLTTKQWFTDPSDPFHRVPSVMSYDRKANAIVKQDSRVWIAGLSDEAGAGSWLAAAMKELGDPNQEELNKYQLFVDSVLWGRLQYKEGANKYGVRKSLFYYQPDELPPGYYESNLDWKSWTSWNKQASEAVNRSFNYPHVAAAYWVLYHLARNHPGLIANHPWDWYLRHAYETSMAMSRYGPDLAEFGQMEGDVFVQILEDLKSEGMAEQANALEAVMRKRADRWNAQAYPFGSEMPWDSTGQEEVYAWTKHFGYTDKAEVTLDAILGYDPTIPSWGYNGSARRYWDFIYGGKYRRLERQLHHYGSGINAIPLLAEYREHPGDLYLLRVGYAGTMGALTNIDQDGFASAAFHAFPDMLKFDPYSGDYGPNFFGYAWNTATYIVHDPELGWLSFGGNIKVTGTTVEIMPLDAFRSRIYIAPVGLWLTLDSGRISSARFDLRTKSVRLTLDAASRFTQAARLRLEQPVHVSGIGSYRPVSPFKAERGAYVIPLGSKRTTVMLTMSQ
jgi:hypothetical protein